MPTKLYMTVTQVNHRSKTLIITQPCPSRSTRQVRVHTARSMHAGKASLRSTAPLLQQHHMRLQQLARGVAQASCAAAATPLVMVPTASIGRRRGGDIPASMHTGFSAVEYMTRNAQCRMKCIVERTCRALSERSMGSRSMQLQRGRTRSRPNFPM